MFPFKTYSRGYGWLAGVLFIGVPLALRLGADLIGGPDTYLSHARWLSIVSMLVPAVIVWFLGRWLNHRDSPHAVSNATVAHSFLRLRLEYWAGVYAALAVLGFLIYR